MYIYLYLFTSICINDEVCILTLGGIILIFICKYLYIHIWYMCVYHVLTSTVLVSWYVLMCVYIDYIDDMCVYIDYHIEHIVYIDDYLVLR